MQASSLILSFILLAGISVTEKEHRPSSGDRKKVEALSQELLQKVKKGESTEALQKDLADLSKDALEEQLGSDAEKIAFWLNIYNAHIQILLKEDPSLYEDRDAFFGEERISIAGERLSFDKIEHGLLRRSKIKAGMGHVQKPFPGSFEKRFRVDEVDPRIHFALNCGARTCPPVAVYHSERLDRELDYMARNFLKESTVIDGDEAHVTRLFSWFRGDFGGKDGMKEMLRNYDVIGSDEAVDLVFKEYDWTLDLGNYRDLGSALKG